MTRFTTILHLRIALLALALGVGSVLVQADPFPDTHGDDVGTASPVSVGASVIGEVEIDIDRDWFSFTAERFTTYTVEVTPSGLWDASVAAYSFHGEVPLGTTSSVGAASAKLTWLNTSYDMTVYVDVSGFAKFTTGTYELVVSAQPLPDGDGDGLTDDFELQYFGGDSALPGQNHDGDAFTNLEEQWLGSDPTNATSGLIITSMLKEGSSNEVTWISTAGLVYELESASALGPATWGGVATVLGSGPSTTVNDPSGAPDRFYRVRAKDLPDLHPDGVSGAAPLDDLVHGAIDMSGDKDWFRFTAEEDVGYTIRVTPAGTWDAHLAAWALAGGYALGTAEGVAGAVTEIEWENTGRPEEVYVEIAGLGPEDTGLYTVDVIGKPMLDSEPDGLPDAWELNHFVNLSQGPTDDTDGDGFTNLEEKKLGTHPDDPASGLFMTSVQVGATSNLVTWMAAPLRVYEVQAATGVDAGWTTLGTATGTGPTASMTEPGPTTQRFYRVLFAP